MSLSQVLDSQLVWIEALIHDQLNYHLTILLRVLLVCRYDEVEQIAVLSFHLAVGEYHVDNFEVLALYGQVNDIAMSFGLDTEIQLIEVVFEQMFGTFKVFALQSNSQRRRVILISYIHIDYRLVGIVIKVKEVSSTHHVLGCISSHIEVK